MSERTTRHDSTNVEINKASLEWYGTKKSKLARNDSVLNGTYWQMVFESRLGGLDLYNGIKLN